jgi:Zn-dependent M16 (insulinase) family peptidase
MKTRESIRGFDVIARQPVPEYRADGTHLRHTGTGCEVFHLATADTENLFAFCFTTPPRDDTGVSHIIEHSVLSGSRRYPVKEPFSVLMKGSLHTFLNALTYPDRTVYPAASCNRADFMNLLSVYADAVFNPLLRKETFMQEAWRLEESEEGAGVDSLHFAGIVYNEMKGAYSSPDSIVAEWMTRSLFPDTPYRFDSGGDPAFIPSLSLESAQDFHARYYHPSNCRIFLYGDMPLEGILEILDREFLSRFSAQRIHALIPLQKPWTAPRRLEKTFPVMPDTPLEGRSSVTLSWLLPAVTDPVQIVLHEVLSEVLIESAGSPLRKTLVDSGLGEDLSPVSGLETDLKQMLFAVGLRGTEPDREERISGLIMDTLSRLAAEGLEETLVQSMINRVEFRHREIRGNGSPYALRLMGRALRGWVHGLDPFASLGFDSSMKELKVRLAADPKLLEKTILSNLVSNPHRLTLVVRPDPGQEARDAAEESARLKDVIAMMTGAQKEKALRESRAYKAFQLAPDSPESLAAIPMISRADIPRNVERIPMERTRTAGGVDLGLHDIFTNEIVYFDFAFPTDSLEGELSLLLPLFGRAVTGMGLPGVPYDKVALELSRLTGGFSSALDAGGVVGRASGFAQYAFFRLRCLRQNLTDAMGLVTRLLSQADFNDLGRLRDIIVEMRNDFKSALMPSGHQFAMLRAASMISAAVAQEEKWRGITQLLFLEKIVSDLEKQLPRIASELDRIRAMLLSSHTLFANATAEKGCFTEIKIAVDVLAAALPGRTSATVAPAAEGGTSGTGAESLVASATVGYVARAIPGIRYDDPLNGPLAVLGHLLSTGFLWEKVRMEGGAYGAFSYPRNTDGLFLMGSYRDPNIVSTLRFFDEGLAVMETGNVNDSELDMAVIGAVGKEDRPIDPGEKGFVSLQRVLHGVTDDARQARRARLLAVNRASLAAAAHALRGRSAEGFTAVIASRAALQAAAADMPVLATRVLDLPE